MTWTDDPPDSHADFVTAEMRVSADLDRILEDRPDARRLFNRLSQSLLQEYAISKGFLALREDDQTRFLAVAAFKEGGTRKHLSLRLPNVSSLFEKVAETGQIYSENFAALFDGNYMEKALLIDDDTVSFMLRPLKHDGRVVALIGYSSSEPEAFIAFEEGLIDPVFERVAEYLAETENESRPVG